MNIIRKKFKSNLKSGLTVALISLPLAVSLAVSSGSTPVAGIITAVWAGLVAAVFGGSHYNILGPTGALSGIVATYALLNGSGSLPMLTLCTGVIILIGHSLRVERYLMLIPSSVIHGFTLGVAVIIGLGQLNFILGLQNMPVHESFFANIFESVKHCSEISWMVFGIFAAFLVILLLLKKFTPTVPGAIILVPFGILLGYMSETNLIPISLQTLGSKFGNISFRLFEIPHFGFSLLLLKTSAVVALVAILETLLSAKIADGMTHTRHNERKEVFGLGLANIVSGLVGGIPATAALARTSLNIKTGANHRTSALISGVSIAIISFVLLRYFRYIPLTVIGAILVFVAIQMIEKEHFDKLWQYERTGYFIALLVAGVTVVYDPVFGILLGVVVSLLIFVDRISHGHYKVRISKMDEDMIEREFGENIKVSNKKVQVLQYSFRGKLCYINGRAHIERFEGHLKKYKTIILRLGEIHFIDTDGIEALDEIIDLVEARGQQVLLSGIDQKNLYLFEKLSSGYKKLKAKGYVFKKVENALAFLVKQK